MATLPALLNPFFLPLKPPNKHTTKPFSTLPFSLTRSSSSLSPLRLQRCCFISTTAVNASLKVIFCFTHHVFGDLLM